MVSDRNRRRRRRSPTPLAELIEARTRRWRILHLQRLQIIRRVWPRAAGDYVARNVQPARLVRRTLRLAVEDSSWAQEMAYLAGPILERLQKLLPGNWVDRLKVVASEPFPGEVETSRETGYPAPVEASEEMRQTVAGACRQIADAGVAAAFGRAMLRYLRLDAARGNALDGCGKSGKESET